MVLVYLPRFARTKSPSHVGKYTSTMVRIWVERNPNVLRKPPTFYGKTNVSASPSRWSTLLAIAAFGGNLVRKALGIPIEKDCGDMFTIKWGYRDNLQ